MVGSPEKHDALVKTAAKLGFEAMDSRTEFSAKYKVYCDKPVKISRSSRGVNKEIPLGKMYLEGHPETTVTRMPGITVNLFGPCRKCPKCLFVKREHWLRRVSIETSKGYEKTWFYTITFTKGMMSHAIKQIPVAYGSEGYEVYLEKALYRFVRMHMMAVKARVRRADGSKIAYLAVHERGTKTLRSHFHLLVHGTNNLTYRRLTKGFPSIIKDAHLVENPEKCGGYIFKYLSKKGSRVRVTNGYGTRRPNRPRLPKAKMPVKGTSLCQTSKEVG